MAKYVFGQNQVKTYFKRYQANNAKMQKILAIIHPPEHLYSKIWKFYQITLLLS